MNHPGVVAELFEVQTLNLNSMLVELLRPGSEKNDERLRVSDCQPLCVEPEKTGKSPEGAPWTSMDEELM